MKKLYVQMVGRGQRALPPRIKPKRFVTAPCSACGVVHKLNELVRVGLNDRKVFICNACLDK